MRGKTKSLFTQKSSWCQRVWLYRAACQYNEKLLPRLDVLVIKLFYYVIFEHLRPVRSLICLMYFVKYVG